MKNIIIGFLTGVILIGGVVWYFSQQKTMPSVQKPVVKISSIPSISPTKTITQQPTVGVSEEDEKIAIAKTLALKNKWDSWENLVITISSNDGTYAKGGATEKGAEAGGGYWFAKKVSGKWEIVADGNGIILCSSLAAYPDYPKSFIPECYDDKKDVNVTR